MKTIKKVDIGSIVLYAAVLVAIWTLVVGIYYWLLGWLFGAQSWFIDMNLANWTAFTFRSLLAVLWKMIVNGLGGALAGLVIGLVYNAAVGVMGGIKLEIE
jgi:hypothetical protein